MGFHIMGHLFYDPKEKLLSPIWPRKCGNVSMAEIMILQVGLHRTSRPAIVNLFASRQLAQVARIKQHSKMLFLGVTWCLRARLSTRTQMQFSMTSALWT